MNYKQYLTIGKGLFVNNTNIWRWQVSGKISFISFTGGNVIMSYMDNSGRNGDYNTYIWKWYQE